MLSRDTALNRAVRELADVLKKEASHAGMSLVLEEKVPLAPLTTYRAGGPAQLLARLREPREMRLVASVLAKVEQSIGVCMPVLILGKGSNLIVSDKGFPGLVIVSPDILEGTSEGIAISSEDATDTVALRVASGIALPVLARRSVALGLTGFEWAVGVPGSAGGAVAMNAGGHGSQLSEVFLRCEVVSLETGEWAHYALADMDFGYRQSCIGPRDLVTWLEICLSPGNPEAARREISEIVKWRREHQPGGSNAGSVFANPPGDSAGRLIEQAGLKGYRIGSAQVSLKHANFFQLDDGGSAEDLVELMVHVRSQVAESFGIELRAEVRLAGFEPEVCERAGAMASLAWSLGSQVRK